MHITFFQKLSFWDEATMHLVKCETCVYHIVYLNLSLPIVYALSPCPWENYVCMQYPNK